MFVILNLSSSDVRNTEEKVATPTGRHDPRPLEKRNWQVRDLQ